MAKKQLKLGAREGGGPPPGYLWSVFVLDFVYTEAKKAFNRAQYDHLVMQMKELAREKQPTHSRTSDIRRFKQFDFYELRDRGGVLNAVNARVFWGLDNEKRAIVVIGAIKKENNGPTPQGDLIKMRSRWRKYTAGEYGHIDN